MKNGLAKSGQVNGLWDVLCTRPSVELSPSGFRRIRTQLRKDLVAGLPGKPLIRQKWKKGKMARDPFVTLYYHWLPFWKGRGASIPLMNILIEARVQTADSHGEKYTYRSAPEGTILYKQAGIEWLTALDNMHASLILAPYVQFQGPFDKVLLRCLKPNRLHSWIAVALPLELTASRAREINSWSSRETVQLPVPCGGLIWLRNCSRRPFPSSTKTFLVRSSRRIKHIAERKAS